MVWGQLVFVAGPVVELELAAGLGLVVVLAAPVAGPVAEPVVADGPAAGLVAVVAAPAPEADVETVQTAAVEEKHSDPP